MGLEEVVYGGVLRFIQALAMGAPTILIGLFVAGVYERLFGYETTRRLYGGQGQGLKALFLAWLTGMLLPGCSLGVIPMVRVLRRAGLSGGTVIAFALSAPLFDPISLIYGLTLSRPLVVISFALCSLAVVTVVGLIWDKLFPDPSLPIQELPPVAPGIRRMLAVGTSALREAASPVFLYLLLGLLGTSLLGMFLPHGALQRAMNGDNPFAPLSMTLVSIPAYATPMLAMSQLGSMFQHGNSVGAAYVLLTFGTGLNVGLLAWIIVQYGWKRSLCWLAMVTVTVLVLAYAIDKPLYPRDIDPADHTHAFDIYCNPFPARSTNPWETTQMMLHDTVGRPGRNMLLALSAVFAAGLLLQIVDRGQRLESWLTQAQPRRGGWDIYLPSPVLGGLLLVGLVVLSVAGCFVYYPPAEEVFADIRIIRAEALSAAHLGDSRQADHWIALWDDSTRRLEIGTLLRDWRLTDYQHMKARILREKLELLRHEVEDGDKEAATEMLRQTELAHGRLRKAFLRDASSPAE